MQKRKKVIIGIGMILGAFALGFFLFFVVNGKILNGAEKSTQFFYLAGTSADVALYNDKLEKEGSLPRGIKVEKKKNAIKDEKGNVYQEIVYESKIYFVSLESLVEDEKSVVLEDKMYVRTPITIYQNENDSTISGMAKKGEELEIVGFDKIDDKGNVHLYHISYQGETGYAYGKYLLPTKEEALKNYDEENTFLVHMERKDGLGGGAGGDADFYPYEKMTFENNPMPKEVRALYLNGGVVSEIDAYIELAKKSHINALVIDIKDGSLSYASKVAEVYSKANYKEAILSLEDYKKYIKKAKDAGLYLIGRITVFKDYSYASEHKNDAITKTKYGSLFEHNGSYWPSAYQRSVWEYNVKLAREAVKEMGFHEIQFDYVRFPDNTYKLEKNGEMDMKNEYQETKIQAIQGFLMYACDEIHKDGAYVSADVFGESAHNYVTGYGQYWGAISNVVDVISAMPYPDHFGAYEYGFNEVVWTVPYDLLNYWGTNFAMKRQKEIPTPAITRTWIQAYNAIRAPYIEYDASKMEEQIKGLYDAGLTGGYMTWNAGSSLSKYQQISEAFKKEYIKS